MRFAIVGPGKVGSALAIALIRAGHDFAGAVGRRIESARNLCQAAGAGRASIDPSDVLPEAELILLTVPDRSIAKTCAKLSKTRVFAPGATLAHCSGALPSTVLAPAREMGAHVGRAHPLQTFPSTETALVNLPGTYWCCEGDPEAVSILETLVDATDGHTMRLSAESASLYHSAAVFACNYLVALEDMASELMIAAGVEPDIALPALLPIIRATVSNMENCGVAGALTGPIIRGDVETVRAHVKALATSAPHLVEVYRLLGRRARAIASQGGRLDGATLEALAEILE